MQTTRPYIQLNEQDHIYQREDHWQFSEATRLALEVPTYHREEFDKNDDPHHYKEFETKQDRDYDDLLSQ